MNLTYLDDKYFVDGKENLNLYQDTMMDYVDPDFSLSHDYMVSEIIAYDRPEVFISTEIEDVTARAVYLHSSTK